MSFIRRVGQLLGFRQSKEKHWARPPAKSKSQFEQQKHLAYVSSPQLKGGRSKARTVSSEYANDITRLTSQLYKASLKSPKIFKLIDALFKMEAYDALLLTLNKRKAPNGCYLHASRLALAQHKYTLALRLLRDVLQPVLFRPIVIDMVKNQNWGEIEKIAQLIKSYIVIYLRKDNITASFQQQHVYAYAAIEHAALGHSDIALSYLSRARRCFFAWEAVLLIFLKDGMREQVQELIAQSGVHQLKLKTVSSNYINEGAPSKLEISATIGV